MNIHGLGAGATAYGQVRQNADSAHPKVKNEKTDPTASEPAKVKGAVRLLQAGHFKGVADVRLRINFHEELSQLGSQNVKAEFESASEDFLAGLDEGFSNLNEGTGATEDQLSSATELFDGFKSSIQDQANVFFKDSGTDFRALANSFQAGFEALVSELQTLLAAATADSSPADSTDEPSEGSPFDDFRALFSAQLDQLVDSVEQAPSVLPEVSEPTGNGVAFAKFMEILDGLNAAETDAEPDALLPEILV